MRDIFPVPVGKDGKTELFYLLGEADLFPRQLYRYKHTFIFK